MIEPTIEFRHSPEIEEARRICFAMAEAEHRLKIDNRDLPLSARIENILQGCMMNPQAVDPGLYAIIYKLAAG